ncbi:hypothetical protein EV361DRAFT_956727 [Lentinula raphanica]|nr:hypothetical protein EV361DRAFT_956727 [Lentinula raphanica]
MHMGIPTVAAPPLLRLASTNGVDSTWRRRQTIKRGVTRKVKLTKGKLHHGVPSSNSSSHPPMRKSVLREERRPSSAKAEDQVETLYVRSASLREGHRTTRSTDLSPQAIETSTSGRQETKIFLGPVVAISMLRADPSLCI